jgi:hypothetical protein
MACSLGGTAIAVVLFVVAGRGNSDSTLRVMGASAGAALAIAAAVLSLSRRDAGVHWDDQAQSSVAPRFFLERRRTPRHTARAPVRLSVNGRTCDATVLCVSGSGALLRLRAPAGRELQAEVGQPVRIDEYPAGRLARIGAHGVYVDFAVEFEPAAADADTATAAVTSSSA